MKKNESQKVVFVVGPTASGKSGLSYGLQNRFGGGILNSDSLQVYKSLNIGTAKPSAEEMAKGAPHYLFDYVAEGNTLTAGGFRRDALSVFAKTDHSIYWGVGGSGFYINALVSGMFEEAPVKEKVVKELLEYKEIEGEASLYKKLQQVDPDYANKIHQNDQYRVLRGLQLVLSLGKTMAQIQDDFNKKKEGLDIPFFYLGVKMDRETLRQRVRLRLEQMLEKGFIAEVEGLLMRGLGEWKPMQSVGYKEAILFLQGKLGEEEFFEEVVKNTMRLAKRQMTWFRKVEGVHWVENLEEALKIKELIEFVSMEK